MKAPARQPELQPVQKVSYPGRCWLNRCCRYLFAASLLNIGNQIVAGLIDKGVELATQAVSAAATAGSFGMGGQAAGPAASILFGTIGDMAKVGTKFGFQAASIGIDALIEQRHRSARPAGLGMTTRVSPRRSHYRGLQQRLWRRRSLRRAGREPAPEPPGTQHLTSGLPIAPGPGAAPVAPAGAGRTRIASGNRRRCSRRPGYTAVR